MFLIEAGLLRFYHLQANGKEFNKNFFTNDELLCPLTPAMWQQPSPFAIASLVPTRLWVGNAGTFRALLNEQDAWQALQQALLERVLTAKLLRETELQALDAQQRYLSFCQRFPTLAAQLPLVQLASYLGITDVSLSRIRRQLDQS